MLFEKTFFVVGWKKSIGGPWIVFGGGHYGAGYGLPLTHRQTQFTLATYFAGDSRVTN